MTREGVVAPSISGVFPDNSSFFFSISSLSGVLLITREGVREVGVERGVRGGVVGEEGGRRGGEEETERGTEEGRSVRGVVGVLCVVGVGVRGVVGGGEGRPMEKS